MLIKRIKPDSYLKKFVECCKDKFSNNLVAIVVYGSYAWGFFDEKKSDYDVFVFFKDKVPKGKNTLKKRFKRVSISYYMTINDVLKKGHFGHFTSYITLLKSGRVVYSTNEYKKFLRKLQKINLFEEIVDVGSVEAKTIQRANILKKRSGFKAAKWALPSIRVQLQMLTYIRRGKLIWNLKKNLRKNKDILTKKERSFVRDLNKRVKERDEKFGRKDKKSTLDLMYKLNKEIILHLGSLFK